MAPDLPGGAGAGIEVRQSETPMTVNIAHPDTAGESAYRHIRHDIIFGLLAPGSRLRLERLKAPYRASVSTLREILYRLSSEGLVNAEGQRGFEVAPVSQRNFREVAAMRQLLEAHAMRESFERGDIEWEGRVVAAHHKLTRMEARMLAGERSETETWKRFDREFHHALISACGSAALLEAHTKIFDQYLRYQVIAVIFRGGLAAEEHQKLARQALARDHAAATAVLGRHIGACVEHTLKNGLLPE